MHFQGTRPKNDPALGGWKPAMLNAGVDIPVVYGKSSKSGYYESSLDKGTIARRVELPEWVNEQLSDASEKSLLKLMQAGSIQIPPTHSKERQGHVFWNPSPDWSRPAVGVDEVVFRERIHGAGCREVVFVVYLFGKRELERWRITKDRFVSESKSVQTSSTFVAQRMVCVTSLELGSETIAKGPSINNPFENLRL
jgi:hypothetical protein